jgi:hypothetical protein
LIKAKLFSNSVLRTQEWYIQANAPVTEMHDAYAERRVQTAKVPFDIPLDPNRFRVLDPSWEDRIADHVCFEYTSPQGRVTTVYVHENFLRIKPPTWVEKNTMNVI